MNKNDLRYLKTERNIKSAFLGCVEALGFEKTGVSDICAQGMMSRNTFYAHYEDKYALLGSIYRDLEKEFSSSISDGMRQEILGGDITQRLSWYIGIVAANRELFRILLQCPVEGFEELLLRSVILDPLRPLIPNLEKRLEELPVQLNIVYMFHAMIRFTQLWLEHYDSLPVAAAERELGRLCAGPVELFMEKLLGPAD